ncbi:MAG: ABC transporter substrate-binding protein [Bacillota bacterium]
MKKQLTIVFFIMVIILGVFNLNIDFEDTQKEKVSVKKNTSQKNSIQKNLPQKNDGKKWRIGYCESEKFINYAGTFFALLKGLEEMGWILNIDNIPYQEGQNDTKVMWEWLNNHATGPYIEFVSDAHYNLYSLDEAKEKEIIDRLKNKKDIDLMIVMGSAAGKFLANNKHDTPTMVFSATNAVQSQIIKSKKDSGIDHIWAHMDADRFKRQVSVLYDVFNFKKLGVVYENSPIVKDYSAIADIEEVANKKGFELIEYHVKNPINQSDKTRYYKDLAIAYDNIAKEIDAMYITVAHIEASKLNSLLKPFYTNEIPVFSQLGDQEVKYGAFMSISLTDYKNMGRFGANQISKVLRGAKPRDLNQVFKSTPQIVLNTEVADKIKYKPPFKILLIADKIYNKIKNSGGQNE